MRWDANTKKQFEQMNEYFTPDPIDTLCFHLQSGSSDGSHTYVMDFNMFGKTITSEEYFKAYYDTAKSLGKACFFGEFGDMLEMETAPDVIEKFKEVTSAISSSGIQIAALWQFQDYTNEGVAGEKLEVLSELNKQLKADGKQDVATAWDDKTEVTETQTETETETETDKVTDTEAETTEQQNTTEEKSKPNTGLIIAVSAAATVAVGLMIALIVKKKKK